MINRQVEFMGAFRSAVRFWESEKRSEGLSEQEIKKLLGTECVIGKLMNSAYRALKYRY